MSTVTKTQTQLDGFNRISMRWLIAPAIVIAFAIVIAGPALAPHMTANAYATMVGTAAAFALVLIVLGLIYFALGEGHPLRTAVKMVVVMMSIVVVVSSDPVTHFWVAGLRFVFDR